MTMTTSAVGRHSELLAITALLANGYDVLEPVVPGAYDLGVTKPRGNRLIRAQCKTALYREKDGIAYYVTRGKRKNGRVYTKEEVDVFIVTVNDEVYAFDNREISEYWTRVDAVDETWTKMPTRLNPDEDFTLDFNETEAV